VVVLPLYPQYSTTTTAPIFDILDAHGGDLPITRVVDFHVDEAWVEAVAAKLRAVRGQGPADRHLLFSFHGLPQQVADDGDPYPVQCKAGARAIAGALGLGPDDWSMSYQSKFGPSKWLEPATTDIVEHLAARGISDLDVACPGFSVDCLETLEEIAIRLGEQVTELGGTLRYIECLNDDDSHAHALAGVVRRAADVPVGADD
jgi:ferrochelatase